MGPVPSVTGPAPGFPSPTGSLVHGSPGHPAELTLLLVQDRDRIAGALNDVVINRMFSAGLSLETALGLLDGHRGTAGKAREALGELDLAIRDVRNVVFDHQRPDSPSGGPPG